MMEGYSDYLSSGFHLLQTKPLEVTYSAMAECAMCVERVKIVERQAVPRIEMDALRERLKSVERAIALMGNAIPSGRTVGDHTPILPSVGPSKGREFTAAVERFGLLGLRLQDGGDEPKGLIVMEVASNSAASKAQLRPGHIISHVGTAPVTTLSDFAEAIQGSDAVVKLAVYDPEAARVRVVTLGL
ncbi:hypothetical protein TraAM80_00685 [Trypanosoma rangeli]|uniref:PDZ domain-containing protein n=1 Tax=Trypanosoma rangeli TaxID=5698 RepID=A0A3R7RS89_TRYRA|nr:uncharacterized protein TraAM80_00685 [Trypanosoma rangeli]RNF11850.1 hypothetical protein TraAM80_00685 [Trypanosoma rangeli]|eukprot:RNF11850.1 hypothetical protein TraAM80_00685 [Trypanosoma rangeli]